jgi:hypothetical protein
MNTIIENKYENEYEYENENNTEISNDDVIINSIDINDVNDNTSANIKRKKNKIQESLSNITKQISKINNKTDININQTTKITDELRMLLNNTATIYEDYGELQNACKKLNKTISSLMKPYKNKIDMLMQMLQLNQLKSDRCEYRRTEKESIKRESRDDIIKYTTDLCNNNRNLNNKDIIQAINSKPIETTTTDKLKIIWK